MLHRAAESFNADLQTAVSQLLTTALRTDPHNVPDHLLTGVAASLAGVVLRTEADAADDPRAVGAALMACGALSQLASWAPATRQVRGSILAAAEAAAGVAAHASPRTLAQLSELLVGVAPLVAAAAARLEMPRSHAADVDDADMHSEVSQVADDAEHLLVACESLLTQVHTDRPSRALSTCTHTHLLRASSSRGVVGCRLRFPSAVAICFAAMENGRGFSGRC